MRKRKLINRIAMFFMVFVLVFTNAIVLYAEEGEGPGTEEGAGEAGNENPDGEGAGGENPGGGSADGQTVPGGNNDETVDVDLPEEGHTEETVDVDGDDESLKVPVIGKILSIDKEVLSFGTIKTTDRPRPLNFVIKNESLTDNIKLGWSQTDTTGIFKLNMPLAVNDPVAPGAGIKGSVDVVDEKIAPGDYSTTLIFTDVNTNAQVTADVSLRIEKPGPVINRVKLWPDNVSLRQGSSMKFDVTVDGENEPDTSVSWRIQDQNSGDTYIDADGNLYVSKDESAGSITVIVTSNQNSNYKDTAKVIISKDKYVVNASVEPAKAGSVIGTGSYNGGEYVTLTASPNRGYSFYRWLDEDGNEVTKSVSFTTGRIKGDLKYKAVFEESELEIKVRSADEDKGTVRGGGRVKREGTIKIEAVPEEGYVFDGWYEDDILVSNKQKMTLTKVKKSHSFVAEFKKDKHVVQVSAIPEEGGSVSGSGNYKTGSEAMLKASPAPGYHFRGFVINNQIISESPEYKLKNIDRDLSVTGYFEKDGVKTHKIKSGRANSGGAISPSGDIEISEGSSITYAIAPDNGYGILEVSVDGKKIGAVTSYTFEDVREDHVISVAFAPKMDSVNDVEMDDIITTEEAAAIAVAKLRKGKAGSSGRTSTIITPEEYAAMKAEEKARREEAMGQTEGDTNQIVMTQEQNLIGMDDTEDLKSVVDTYNPDIATGVYQSLDITKETAEKMIDCGSDDILINEAYKLGILDVIINNEYMVPGKEGEILDLSNNTTVKNIQEVIRACLTREEKLAMLEGEEVVLSFSISGAENPGEYEKDAMKGAKGVSVDRYLYMTLIKTIGGVPHVVEELETPMQITMEIPEELRDPEKKFCIVRNHNGQVDILEDIDDDPNTITIMTDRFSPYAIGHFSGGNNMMIFVGIAIAFALTLLIIASYINMKDRKKRERRTTGA